MRKWPAETCSTFPALPPSKLLVSPMPASRKKANILKVHLESQLDLAPGIPGVRYLAELRCAQSRTGIAETGVVHEVEKFCAQFHMTRFPEPPSLVQREIQIIQRIRAQDIAAGIAERVLCRLSECGRVEPALWRAVRDGIRIANDVGILRGAT